MKNEKFTPHEEEKILLPFLTEEDLEVFRGKKVVILGCTPICLKIYDLFFFLKVDVLGVYENRRIEHKIYAHFYDIPSLSFGKLKKIAKKENLIFVSTNDKMKLTEKERNVLGQEIFSYPPEMIIASFYGSFIFEKIKHSPQEYIKIEQKKEEERKKIRSFQLRIQHTWARENSIIICNPGKTADHTLNQTFNKINGSNLILKGINVAFPILYTRCKHKIFLDIANKVTYALINKKHKKINYTNIFHTPVVFDENNYKNVKKIKIITAVREPISQNISGLFQRIGTGGDSLSKQFVLDNFTPEKNKIDNFYSEYKEIFIKNNSNVQTLFDTMLNNTVYQENTSYNFSIIQKFIPLFCENILDLLSHPFDQEKGYAIMKEGNIEVFVYQLEKLNSIVPELSAWVGVPFDKLEKSNVGEDKWIGDSYKQAQKHLKITQEYFDKCYNEPYVKHFYSPEDIEKFKERWRPHIREE